MSRLTSPSLHRNAEGRIIELVLSVLGGVAGMSLLEQAMNEYFFQATTDKDKQIGDQVKNLLQCAG